MTDALITAHRVRHEDHPPTAAFLQDEVAFTVLFVGQDAPFQHLLANIDALKPRDPLQRLDDVKVAVGRVGVGKERVMLVAPVDDRVNEV